MPLPQDGPIQPGGPQSPTQGAMGGAPAPSLAGAPGQGSAFGGSPVGMGGSSDPKAALQKAQLLRNAGAISEMQYQMIVAKLSGQPIGARPGAGPAAATTQPPLTTTGVPGGGQGVGMNAGTPSPQWNQ